MVSTAYLKLFIFLPAILIPAYASSSQAFTWYTLIYHISNDISPLAFNILFIWVHSLFFLNSLVKDLWILSFQKKSILVSSIFSLFLVLVFFISSLIVIISFLVLTFSFVLFLIPSCQCQEAFNRRLPVCYFGSHESSVPY